MANPTLVDIAKMNGTVGGIVEDSLAAAPEVASVPARTIMGTTYETLHRTTLPTTGFRNFNEGSAPTKSVWDNKIVQTHIIDEKVRVDAAAAQAHEDGAEVLLANEASGIMESVLRMMGSQFYYGTATAVATSTASSPTKGYPGLVEVYDTAAMEVDAAGTGSATSSVWYVNWSVNGAVQWVIGNNGSMTLGPTKEVEALDSNSLEITFLQRNLLFFAGLQLVNLNTIARIKNLHATSSGNTLTDDFLYQTEEKFPVGLVPDACFMTRRSLRQLRESRTATTTSGRPADLPTVTGSGVPIIVSDSIVNTETAT